MSDILTKMLSGYQLFRKKYALGDHTTMQQLSHHGQHPEIAMVACCDSRVDPSVILQCSPGDLFVIRNVANIIPPYSHGSVGYHDTAAALEFSITHLNVNHLVIFGHSQCGGIKALVDEQALPHNEFITQWVSLLKNPKAHFQDLDYYAKLGLFHSYHNCLTYPWIKERVEDKRLALHQWFFNLEKGEVEIYSHAKGKFHPLDDELGEF